MTVGDSEAEKRAGESAGRVEGGLRGLAGGGGLGEG